MGFVLLSIYFRIKCMIVGLLMEVINEQKLLVSVLNTMWN